jgi:SAM-dependent methyltransferase
MIESNNPEIDVNQLMQRIRAEAARRRDLGLLQENGSGDAVSTVLPQVQFLAPLPPMVSPRRIDVKEERLTSILQRAREKTEVSKRIPKLLRRLFRKQGSYNKLLLESVAVLTKTNVELNKRLQELAGAFEIQNRWLSDLKSARHADAAWMRAAARIINALKEQASRIQAQQDQFGTRAGEHLRNLQSEVDRFAEQARHLNNLQTQTDNQDRHLNNLRTQANDAKQLALRADERQNSDGAYLKSELHLLHRRLMELASTSGEGATSSAKNAPLPIDKHEFDALYVAFENQFRGSRELIKERLRVYLDDVRGAGAVTADSPILDLGCGRGEWLELVNENGLAGEGVDSNAIMVSACEERGLRVTEGDALEYLRALPAESRGAITAFHLIEHLEFQVLVQLLRESFRVLRPGGLAIFETPNPDNVLVGSNGFYYDPTHLHPLPKEYSRFMLQSVGFSDVVARPLNPDNRGTGLSQLFQDSLPENAVSPELRNFLNRLFFGERDYAVIGKRQ